MKTIKGGTMNRKLWKPSRDIINQGIDETKIEKHCGNCHYGVKNHPKWQQFLNGELTNPNDFDLIGCPHPAHTERTATGVLVTSTCSGEQTFYPFDEDGNTPVIS